MAVRSSAHAGGLLWVGEPEEDPGLMFGTGTFVIASFFKLRRWKAGGAKAGLPRNLAATLDDNSLRGFPSLLPILDLKPMVGRRQEQGEQRGVKQDGRRMRAPVSPSLRPGKGRGGLKETH